VPETAPAEQPAACGLLSRMPAGFLALYILNVAVEAAVGGWEPRRPQPDVT
jgi:FHS family glucose/mannose:H+ symporter-like MFS transporter